MSRVQNEVAGVKDLCYRTCSTIYLCMHEQMHPGVTISSRYMHLFVHTQINH